MKNTNNIFEFDFRGNISRKLKKWIKQGFSEEEAEDWDINGFTLQGAIEFNNKGFTPIDAKRHMIKYLKEGYINSLKIVLPTGTYTKQMLRTFIKKEFWSNII
jgi:hypothetical protein